jgi:hypothetical protein
MATLHTSKKNQTVFLINNYDLILKVLNELNIQSEEVIKFSALVLAPPSIALCAHTHERTPTVTFAVVGQCDEQIASFVNQELTNHYGRMINFVETVRAKQSQTVSPRELNVDKGTPSFCSSRACVPGGALEA